MAPSLLSNPAVRQRLPRLTGHLGDQLAAREPELERLGPVPLWQVEQDLELLERYVPLPEIVRAYRDLLRNPEQFTNAMYEIRVAAMLAPFVEKIELEPAVGGSKCDTRCVIGGRDVFVEVTATSDPFPWTRAELGGEPPPDVLEPRGRATVTREDSRSIGDAGEPRTVPRSKDLADRVQNKLRQLRSLPPEAMAVLVLGETAGLPLNMEDALWGPEVLRGNARSCWRDRLPAGLFAGGEAAGGVSRIGAVVYMRLAPRWNNLRVHSWMEENGRAATPLSREAARVLREVFDRGAVLREELERILTRLREHYDPDRVLVFGSLGRDFRRDMRQRVHQWSDLDLAIVKATPKPYLDRVREVTALIEPRVGVNVLVFTPEEFKRLTGESAFVRDEIVGQGYQVHPSRG